MFRCARIVKANFCVASTRHELIPLFKRFGFKESKSKNQYYSNKAGWMSVLMLDINDRNYLQKTQSPFLTVFDETNDNQSEGFISHG
jgi:hypothetical protein